jgi:pimeloyl-ACP methyl ester carboxylesterase
MSPSSIQDKGGLLIAEQEFDSVYIRANGIKFHCVTAGEGPLCLCLHGFPESWYSWRNQIPLLARSYKVVVPEMRGYGETDAPREVSEYRIPLLVEDVRGLVEAFGRSEATVVSHDWGGIVALHHAGTYPETITKLVVMNAPHFEDYLDLVFKKMNLRQIVKGWYVCMNQIPYLTETLMSVGNYAVFEWLIKRYAVRSDVFSPDVMERWKGCLRKSGLRGGVNYYRATRWAVREHLAGRLSAGPITAPVKIIWGEVDRALETELGYSIEKHVSGGFDFHLVKGSGHWVQQEAAEEVNEHLAAFLGI